MEWLFIDMGSTFVDEEKCDNCRIMETLHHEKAPSNDIVQSGFKLYRNMNINMKTYTYFEKRMYRAYRIIFKMLNIEIKKIEKSIKGCAK